MSPRPSTWLTLRAPATPTAPRCLAPCYGLPVDGADLCHIDAYSEAGAVRKQQFLTDARSYLQATGQALSRLGFTTYRLRVNRSGIAGSGEVYAEFQHPAHARWVFCWIEATCCRFLTPQRRDGLLITARWRDQPDCAIADGPNQHLSASLASATLALRLAAIVDPALLPTGAPVQPALFVV